MIDRDKDPIRYAAEVVGQDPFATLLGIKVEEVRDSYARLSLVIRQEYCNCEARTHGGVLFTLADQAFAVAAHTKIYQAVAVELKINYFQGTRPGDVVVAEASPVDIRNRISLWQIDLKTEAGERVALAQGLAYHIV
jgi:acyl-CoA thioesterase